MAELGYTDGKNFALEFIQLAQPNEWGDAFKELVRRKVEASLKSAMAASDKFRSLWSQLITIHFARATPRPFSGTKYLADQLECHQ